MKQYLTLIFLLTSYIAFAQTKEYKKLNNVYDAKKYKKCIELSKKYLKKKPKELIPNYYCSKANFELFKKDSVSKNLKESLKYMWKINKIDSKQQYTDIYSELKNELQTSSKEYAEKLYFLNKNSAKSYYDYLVRIYNDTLDKFYEFYPELKKAEINSLGLNSVQKDVNKVDSKGRKQGYWTKKYKNGVVAYKVYFKDDKPVGTHKRYHTNGALMAVLVFDGGEWADVEIFNREGLLIGKGKYKNQKKQGLWKIYKKKVLIGEENYNEGKKDGISRTYYNDTQKPSEEKTWKNGVEHGIWRQFYHNGNKRLEAKIENGKRNSKYFQYYSNGLPEIKGAYKQDRMHGAWVYYDTKGKILDVIHYNNGKAAEQDKLDKKATEIFKKIEKNKGRYIDPAKYKNDPQEYFRKIGR